MKPLRLFKARPVAARKGGAAFTHHSLKGDRFSNGLVESEHLEMGRGFSED
jgi:hypothetical protein